MLKHISRGHGTIRIGITQGEISGISPEIIASTLEFFNEDKTLEICVIADKEAASEVRLNLKTTLSKHIAFQEPEYSKVPDDIKDCSELSCIYSGAMMCMDGDLDAIVTAPIDKNKTSKKYPRFSGHTGFLKEILQTDQVLMLMVTPSFKIGIMTEHVPLKDVINYISKERIISSAGLLNDYLKGTRPEPVIGILALNPHSGDSGLVGNEEIDIIVPAIKELNNSGIKTVGPIPGDSAFVPPIKDRCDGMIAMYHDQGMIPAKIKGFDSLVNVTLGLPIIRTSPGHGVAYDIKGKGKASPNSMIKAVNQAIDMVLAERISK